MHKELGEERWQRIWRCRYAKRLGILSLVEREIPQSGAGEVRLKVQACGVCHSDPIGEARWTARVVVSTCAGT